MNRSKGTESTKKSNFDGRKFKTHKLGECKYREKP